MCGWLWKEPVKWRQYWPRVQQEFKMTTFDFNTSTHSGSPVWSTASSIIEEKPKCEWGAILIHQYHERTSCTARSPSRGMQSTVGLATFPVRWNAVSAFRSSSRIVSRVPWAAALTCWNTKMLHAVRRITGSICYITNTLRWCWPFTGSEKKKKSVHRSYEIAALTISDLKNVGRVWNNQSAAMSCFSVPVSDR